MKKEKKCPLCYEKIYSGIGKGCKMCGMQLEDDGREFCSKKCRIKYDYVNQKRSILEYGV